MISVMMQVQQMKKEGQTEEELVRAMKNRDLKKEAQDLEEEIAEFNEELKKEKKTVAEMAKLKDRKIALTLKLDEIKKAQDPKLTDAELQKRVENLKMEVKAIQRERPPLAKELKKLQDELKPERMRRSRRSRW